MEHLKKNIAELTKYSVEEYKRLNKIPLIVLADNVRSMHNIGSVFRTSDAFRAYEFILCGISGTPPHPEISKTALGAENSVEWHYSRSALDECMRLKNEGWKICVLEQTHNSCMLQNFTPLINEKYVLVVGNEVHGVDQKIIDIADYVLEIPQGGTKHSLNVSASAAIAIWTFYQWASSQLAATPEEAVRRTSPV
ncbi:MAG: TrmH family RNA methyltransferase [Candidatus Amulumruptor caecigallinarius]|nr:TrmH family RNA methyltransferase [Candidatus Amulumruptor caecigallinarius]